MLNGIFLGFLTALSVVMTFMKWPNGLKRLAVKHELLADIIAGLSVWAILGMISKTLTAVIGAVIAEIILGLSLHFYVEKYHAGKVLQRPTKQG
jgi:hypothetical protein